MDEREANIVDLSKFSRRLPQEGELIPEDEYFNKGIEKFNESIDNATGFLAVTFDENNSPTIIWAGDVDTMAAVGSFEVAKQLFIEKMFYAQDEYEFEPE